MATAAPRTGILLLLLFLLAGCGSRQDAALNVKLPGGTATVDAQQGDLVSRPDVSGILGLAGSSAGHPYFPIRPGDYRDYRVTRLGVGVRYVRVAVGLPETFFGRAASPFVYGDIPGQVRDSTVFGLREYWSTSPDGDLWFHGAQNNGFMSHTEPPVRMLRARPAPGDAWIDTVLFQSYLPGGIPFFEATYTYTWTLSERWKVMLPAGMFHALRASQVIDDFPAARTGGAMQASALDFRPVGRAWDGFASHGVQPLPDPLHGWWFSKHDGMIARDWPSGQGEVQLNAVTYELIAAGTGPIPPPPPDPGTQ